MPITELLERNANLYGDEVALVEINPQIPETRRVTWKEYDLIDRTIVAACNHYSGRRVKELCPELKCGLLSHSWIVDGEKYVKEYVGVDCYMPNFGQCTAEMVKRYHEAGVEVYTWTANEEVDIEHLINVGVDGIITDFPDQAEMPVV